MVTRVGLVSLLVMSISSVGYAGSVKEIVSRSNTETVQKFTVAERDVHFVAGNASKLADGKYKEDGKYFDKNDEPTYNKNDKDQWDWLSFN
ncbi:MAG: hypothetical protein JJ964_16205, partial [Rhizobiales bacterium]|nr:hypothetical protein [Hyphomicrobiales bacterium]